MKIGVIGKGGVGKTTIAGPLARVFAAAGQGVTALDCDSNPNPGIALGLSVADTERLAGM